MGPLAAPNPGARARAPWLAVLGSVTGALVSCGPAAPSQRETVVPLAEVTPPETRKPTAPVVAEAAVPRPEVPLAPPQETIVRHVDEGDDVSSGVVGGVPGGVMGGVPGGVMGGVPGGVMGGVPGGVVGGVPGGVVGGVLAGAPPSPKASLAGSSAWNCAFPPEADAAKVDSAVVTLVVTVSATGKAIKVMVMQDPGNGFGRAARDCALTRTYKPALDDQGKPIEASTPAIRVKFTR
jgi:protein TonB